MLAIQDIKVFINDLMASTPEKSFEEVLIELCEFHNVDADDYLSSEDGERTILEIKKWLREGDVARGYYFSPCEKYLLNDKTATSGAFATFNTYINKCSPVLFEQVCCVVLNYLGFQEIEPTRLSGDGGIDFLAKYTIIDDIIKLNFSNVTVFGQTKRYGKVKVGIGHIRDFLGATEIIRCGGYKNLPNTLSVPVHSYALCKPFSAQARVLIASNDITQNAAMFADWIGIRLIDGKELAQILHHLKIGFIRQSKSVTFDSKLFKKRITERYKNLESLLPTYSSICSVNVSPLAHTTA
ncbi:MAG: restriction endonuclease [Desulfovibrionaceae bacterium]|nr:restriction endonuclease [Desulfovibrionaceae bacterium]